MRFSWRKKIKNTRILSDIMRRKTRYYVKFHNNNNNDNAILSVHRMIWFDRCMAWWLYECKNVECVAILCGINTPKWPHRLRTNVKKGDNCQHGQNFPWIDWTRNGGGLNIRLATDCGAGQEVVVVHFPRRSLLAHEVKANRCLRVGWNSGDRVPSRISSEASITTDFFLAKY